MGVSGNIYYTYVDPTAHVEAPTPVVSLARTWGGARTWLPWLYPLIGGDNAGGTPGGMSFEWKFGYLEEPGLPVKLLWPFLNCANAYIYVDIITPYGRENLWCGEVEREVIENWGSYPSSGLQNFTAHGLTVLLDRREMQGSMAYCVDGAIGRIGKQLTFNRADRGVLDLGANMSTTPESNGAYVFYSASEGNDPALSWTAWTVADYVLAWNVNRDYEGDNYGPSFYLSGFPQYLYEIQQVWHFSDFCLQAINQLIDPRRGLGYCTLSNGYGDVFLDVFSGYIGGNPNWHVVPLDDRRIRCTIDFDHSRTYDEIEVQGGPICICGTWTMDEAGGYPPLIEGWSAAQQTAYDGITGDTKERDKARQDPTLRSVYQAFRVDPSWDWTNDGNNYAPICDDDGQLYYSAQCDVYPDIAFSREVPFYEDVADGAVPELKRAMAWMSSEGGYSLVEKLTPGAQMSLMDNAMGIIVEPTINHVAALNTFTDTHTDYPPQYDYNTLYVTAMYELPTNLVVRRYLYPYIYPPDVPRKKILKDPDARTIVIAPYTVTGVDTTDPSTFETSGAAAITFRDDSDRLIYRANLAQLWYAQQKSSVTLRIRGIHNSFAPGCIIAGVVDGGGVTPVGTVVRSRTWDFRNQETIISTELVDLDVSGIGTRQVVPTGGGGQDAYDMWGGMAPTAREQAWANQTAAREQQWATQNAGRLAPHTFVPFRERPL